MAPDQIGEVKGRLRLDGQVAVVVGGGQTPGQTIGNGRATAITYARAGAYVLVADQSLDAAAETVAEIEAEGGMADHGHKPEIDGAGHQTCASRHAGAAIGKDYQYLIDGGA